MSLMIVMDQPVGTVYSCGDRVSGVVYAQSAKPITVSNLSLSFKCKVKSVVITGSGTDNKSEHRHKAKAFLFCITKTLPQGVVSLNASASSWTFEFEFPWQALPTPMPRAFWPSPAFESAPGHPLPPSYQMERFASIAYYIEANMQVPSSLPISLFHSSPKIKTVLSFAPARAQRIPEVYSFPTYRLLERTTHKLDPARRDEVRSFREKTKRLFTHHDPDPVAVFLIKAQTPSRTFVGSALGVEVSIEHDRLRSTAPESPEIQILSVHARLTSTMHVRAPTYGTARDSYSYKEHNSKIDLLRCTLPWQPLSISTGLTRMLPPIQIPLFLHPSFKTYNLCQRYVVKITIELKCIDKIYDVDICKQDLEILPALFRAPAPEVLQGAAPLQQWEQVPVGLSSSPVEPLPPPTYDTAVSEITNVPPTVF